MQLVGVDLEGFSFFPPLRGGENFNTKTVVETEMILWNGIYLNRYQFKSRVEMQGTFALSIALALTGLNRMLKK